MTRPDNAPGNPPRKSEAGRDITRALDPDYEAILAAVTETARGRWFLEEYSRRNRTADTRSLLSAIARLENSMGSRPGSSVDKIRANLADLSEIIKRARTEIAVVPNPNDEDAKRRAADDIDFLTEAEAGNKANSTARSAGERMQEIVWGLRERGISSELCDGLDRHAVDILGAAKAGTATLKGMAAMARALRQIEGRVSALIDAFENTMDDEPRPGAVSPDILAADPAAGRFLEDIEFIEVEDAPHTDATESSHASDDLVEIEIDDEAVTSAGSTTTADAIELTDSASEDGTAVADAAEEIAEEPAKPEKQVAMTSAEKAPTEKALAKSVEKPADEPPQGTPMPPADLTGLTFDQKMILFS